MSLNTQIISYARGKLGHKVGKGECWDLAELALREAGAMTSRDLGEVSSDVDYIWGTAVSNAMPGDILQFRDFTIEIVETTVTVKTIKKSQVTTTSTNTNTITLPHHTAIIETMEENGKVVVLNQNSGGKRIVIRDTIYLAGTNYKESEGKTVSVSVSGRVWIYRPMAKPVQ